MPMNQEVSMLSWLDTAQPLSLVLRVLGEQQHSRARPPSPVLVTWPEVLSAAAAEEHGTAWVEGGFSFLKCAFIIMLYVR